MSTTPMNIHSFSRRLLASVPVIFVLETLAMSLILMVQSEFHVKHWDYFAFYSVGFGFFATVFAKVYAKKAINSLGLKDAGQVSSLQDALKKNIAPSDPELMAALPAYLNRSGDLIDRTRKSFRKNLTIFGILIVVSLLTQRWATALLFATMVGFVVYGYKGLGEREERVRLFCAMLETHGVPILDQIETLQMQSKDSKSKSKSKEWSIPA